MIFTSILILIVAKALPSINKNLSPIYFTRLSTIIFIYAGVLSLNTLHIQSIGSGIGIYSGLFQVTQVSILIESFLLIIGSLILISWPSINSNIKDIRYKSSGLALLVQPSTDYSLIVLFSSLGSCLLISSYDLISLYISIELQSFGLYVLSTLYRDSETSTKAGLKYFLLGGLSSCIILLGCGIIYSYTGLTNFESIYTVISTAEAAAATITATQATDYSMFTVSNIIQGLTLGLILIFIGFLFKIAAAPLHNWSPDVYDEVPTIVTIWLTIIPKISILILLLELQYYGWQSLTLITVAVDSVVGSEIAIIKNLLLISSLLSLIIGTVVGLAQTRIKRLLAYSTISHIGFILLALAISSESPAAIDSLLFYIIQYTITNLNVFLIIIALSYAAPALNKEIKDIRYISELKGTGLASSKSILSLSLAICLFSMAGIPPLIGFFSKQFVLYSALQNGYYFISFIAIIVSVISASYYLKIVKVLYTEPTQQSVNAVAPAAALTGGPEAKLENNSTILQSNQGKAAATKLLPELKQFDLLTVAKLDCNYLSNVHSYLISVLTLSILLFILKPSLILNSTQLLSLSLFNW